MVRRADIEEHINGSHMCVCITLGVSVVNHDNTTRYSNHKINRLNVKRINSEKLQK